MLRLRRAHCFPHRNTSSGPTVCMCIISKNLGFVPRSEGLIQTGDWDRPDRLNGGLSKGTKGDSLTAWTREDGTHESD